jgi:hypothetical protein
MSLFQSSMFGSAVLDLVNRLPVAKVLGGKPISCIAIDIGAWTWHQKLCSEPMHARWRRSKQKRKNMKKKALLTGWNRPGGSYRHARGTLGTTLGAHRSLRQDHVVMHMPYTIWLPMKHDSLKWSVKVETFETDEEAQAQLGVRSSASWCICCNIVVQHLFLLFLLEELVEEDDVGALMIPLEGKKFKCLWNGRAQSSGIIRQQFMCLNRTCPSMRCILLWDKVLVSRLSKTPFDVERSCTAPWQL